MQFHQCQLTWITLTVKLFTWFVGSGFFHLGFFNLFLCSYFIASMLIGFLAWLKLNCLSLVHQDPSVFLTDDRLNKQTNKQTPVAGTGHNFESHCCHHHLYFDDQHAEYNVHHPRFNGTCTHGILNLCAYNQCVWISINLHDFPFPMIPWNFRAELLCAYMWNKFKNWLSCSLDTTCNKMWKQFTDLVATRMYNTSNNHEYIDRTYKLHRNYIDWLLKV